MKFLYMEISSKLDRDLTDDEVAEISYLYIDCFFPDEKINIQKFKTVVNFVTNLGMFKWYMAKMDGKVIGIVANVINYDNAFLTSINTVYRENICCLCVNKEFRRHGVGKELLECVVKDSNRVCVLSVLKKNIMFAILFRFYESCGFSKIGESNEAIYMKNIK